MTDDKENLVFHLICDVINDNQTKLCNMLGKFMFGLSNAVFGTIIGPGSSSLAGRSWGGKRPPPPIGGQGPETPDWGLG